MTDIEKAIEYLKEPIGKPLEVHYKAIKLAISALEKQTAKKPVKDREYTLCTNCKRVEIDWLDKYCHGCGQAIDWSVEE